MTEIAKKFLDRDVPFTIFTWAMGIILVLFGFVFTQISSINNNLRELQKGQEKIQSDAKVWQDGITERLIRLDERQQNNIRNLEKVLTKLNIQ